MVLLSENFTYPLIYRDHREKIYYTIVNIELVVLRFIGCPRCARGMPKTSVGISSILQGGTKGLIYHTYLSIVLIVCKLSYILCHDYSLFLDRQGIGFSRK